MEEQTNPGTASPNPDKRRRNAAITRQAILDSARAAFAQHGYHGVGVREIAKNAGVTAMLVNRYFGSKERLFEEVVEIALAEPGVLRSGLTRSDKTPRDVSRQVAAALVAKTEPGMAHDGLAILLRSASDKKAAAVLRDNALRYLQPLVDSLPGTHPDERAAILLSILAGFNLMRQIIALPALTAADPQDLQRRLEALFTCLFCEQPPAPPAGDPDDA